VEERVEKVPLSLRADCSVEHLPHNATQMLLRQNVAFLDDCYSCVFYGARTICTRRELFFFTFFYLFVDLQINNQKLGLC